MDVADHLCRIPCNSFPLVGEADFGLSMKPVKHCDRTAKFNVLIYLLKGRMEIIEDGIVYELTPGTLFFLKNGVHHWGEKPFQIGTSWYYVHFYSDEPTENMTPLENKKQFGEHVSLFPGAYQSYLTVPKILRLPLDNDLEKEIERLIELYRAADIIRMNLKLWDILLRSAEAEYGRSETANEDRRTQKVIDFLEQNYCRNFTSGELEEEIGQTYKYVGTIFKTKTGMTIKEYQLMLRIRKAAKLLCETDMSVAEIANETGFYDAFYFSKMFKRVKEISPQKFRDTYVPKI